MSSYRVAVEARSFVGMAHPYLGLLTPLRRAPVGLSIFVDAGGGGRRAHGAAAVPRTLVAQPSFGVIVTASRSSFPGFGTLTSTTPFLTVASIWSAVTRFGSVTVRENDP